MSECPDCGLEDHPHQSCRQANMTDEEILRAMSDACPVCGSQDRDNRGLLKCECPCPSTLEQRRKIAQEMQSDLVRNQDDAEKEADERIERTAKARYTAKEDAKANDFRKGRGGMGAVACPCCNSGVIRYSVASYNGHMHGRCSTAGCVSWME